MYLSFRSITLSFTNSFVVSLAKNISFDTVESIPSSNKILIEVSNLSFEAFKISNIYKISLSIVT